MLKIRYNKYNGYLNINTGEVYFFQIKFTNIFDAITYMSSIDFLMEEEFKYINSLLLEL